MALSELRSSGRFDQHMLAALEYYAPIKEDFEVRALPVRDLRVGMVLEKDVVTFDGNPLIFKAGTDGDMGSASSESWAASRRGRTDRGAHCQTH